MPRRAAEGAPSRSEPAGAIVAGMSEHPLDDILRAYSEGRATRADVSKVAGDHVSFGELLMLPGARGLPLPHHCSGPDRPGRHLLRDVLAASSVPRPEAV